MKCYLTEFTFFINIYNVAHKEKASLSKKFMTQVRKRLRAETWYNSSTAYTLPGRINVLKSP